ncbi:MAG: hypothetical protein AAFR35_15305 [Pseudomonadota bacterium]
MQLRWAVLGLLAFCAACTTTSASRTPSPIGDFRLAEVRVDASAATMGPLSREVAPEVIEAALRSSLTERLRAYDGDGLYVVEVDVRSYVLAQPGIPLLLSPRSILILDIGVQDVETGSTFASGDDRVIAFEGLMSGVPFLPSGLVKSSDQQLSNLANEAAILAERALERSADRWFVADPARPRVVRAPKVLPERGRDRPEARPSATGA